MALSVHSDIVQTNILETNVLSKFHENWAKNVTSTVEKCPAHWRPFINKTNVLTNFHDDWAKIVTFRVFTRENCHYIHIEKNAPPTGGHVFCRSRPFSNSSKTAIEPMKIAPPTGGHFFQRIGTTFELNQDIIKTNILTKKHEYWA
ncbi:hypothetical protein DPMN_091544 [Dreissena polymorpha]|uniref:Uncharacterized protein n=1 Tax=Dreissena polymorpha TaxID=45954 RepID=A0A9D4R023_DREPO|nr:hypothetical protein DPMN_091544 [Dreissena polymorpha]